MATGKHSWTSRLATGPLRLAGFVLLGVLPAAPAAAEIAPGRAAVLDSFADPFGLGHSGALVEADVHAGPDGNAVALSSSPLLYDARDLSFLADGRIAIVDVDADPSGFGADPNLGNGHGGVFIAATADAAITLLSDGSDYPAGGPPGWPSIFVDPQGVAEDLDGSLLVVDRDTDPSQLGPDASGFSGHGALFRVDAATGRVALVSDGSLSSDGPPPAGAPSWFQDPGAVAVDASGRIFVLETLADPAGLGGTGAVFEVNRATGELSLACASPLFDFPVGLTARPDGLLAMSDQLADPLGDGSRGAIFLLDPDAASPELGVVGLATDPRFRSLQGIHAAADSSLFLADAFADPLMLGHLGSIWRIPVGSPIGLASTDAPYRALSGVSVSPPTGPAPTILAVTPAVLGQEDVLTLTVDGTGFTAPAELELGEGISVAAVRVLSEQLAEADVVVAFDAAPGLRSARFISADWQAGSLADAVEVVPALRPVVAAVSPVTAVQGEALTATIAGTNFVAPVTVSFGDGITVLAARVLDPGTLEADLELDPAALPGPRTVTVTNPDARAGSLVDGFEIVEPAPPALVTVTPSLLSRGQTVEVELSGSNFSAGMDADFGTGISVGKLDVLSSGQARCRLHVLPSAENGPRDGVVTNPDARSGTLLEAVLVSQAPVVRIAGLRIVDSPGGDGEGDLDPGETVGLDFDLHGPSDTLAGNVTLTLENPRPGLGLTILRAGVPFPDIPPASNSRRAAAPYPEVQLAAEASCGTTHPLMVEIQANGVPVLRELIELPVGRVEGWRRKPVSDGTESGGRRGQAVALADLDGDGVLDLVVGAPREDGNGVFDAGRVLATSGATDDPLWTVNGDANNGRFGSALAAVGDLDGDGYDDLLVGAPGELGGSGRVHLLSGFDGASLGTAEGQAGDELGAAVAPAGDRDLDGRSELAVGAPGASNDNGRVFILSGGDLAEMERLNGADNERLGTALAWLGDGDDDGYDDLAVGAPSAAGGSVLLWRGNGGSLRVFGSADGDAFGAALAAGRDADADGAPDLLVGAPLADGGTGRAVLIDGKDGSRLGEFSGALAGDELGRAVALLRDLDGDGIGEVVLGSPGALAGDGRLEVRSGGSGNLLFLREGIAGSAGRLGESVFAGGDAGGDAFPDLIAGAPLAGVPGTPAAGRAPAFKSEAACNLFEPCAPDLFEDDDSFGTAVDVSYGSFPGLTACPDDPDYFRIQPPADGRVLVRILFRHAEGDLDATLHDAGEVLVDASLSLDDDEELGPFGPGGGPWFVRVAGFEGASNSYELLVVDPDACDPTLEIADLRVTKGGPGQVVLSWRPSEDPCHEGDPGEPAYAVHAAHAPEGVDDPGDFPLGTFFLEVTAGDLDGNFADEFHVRSATPGNRYYLVSDIGRAGVRGPVGHYGR